MKYMKRGGLYIKRAVFIVFILIIFLALFFYWNKNREEKILIEEAKEWLGFLKADYIPAEMDFAENNSTFSIQWNTSETSFFLRINPNEDSTKYDLSGLTNFHIFLDEDLNVFLNETSAQRILSIYSSLQPREFKCTAHELPIGNGFNCYTNINSKTIEIFSFDGSLGIGTYISISETVKEQND